MLQKLLKWLDNRAQKYDKQEKARLCAPCAEPCGEEICRKVGCLNMDMRTNSLRLRTLIKRLEGFGYEFPQEKESNVVQLKDYRSDD